MADDVLYHHDRAVHDHAEVERSQRQQVGRNMTEVETDRSEQQRKRNGERNDQCSANIAEEEKEDDHHQDDALGQVVQHRVRGVVQQVAAVEERNDLHSRREEPGR